MEVIALAWAKDGQDPNTGDTAADEAYLDLASIGLKLAEGGWIPQTMTDAQISAVETLTFRLEALDHDQIIDRAHVLDDWKRKVSWFRDQTQRQAVWLKVRWRNESYTRRAFVYSLDYAIGDSPYQTFIQDDNVVPTLTLVIERGHWESIEVTALTWDNGGSPINLSGGSLYLQSGGGDWSVTGDIGARLQGFEVFPSGIATIRYLWAGWRSSRNGILANFQPLWSLYLSVYLLATAGDTVITADATTINGASRLTVTFASTTAEAMRAFMRTLELGLPYMPDDQRGQFKVLLRAKMSDASTARVRLLYGTATASAFKTYKALNATLVSGTSWFLYDMGIIKLPPMAQRSDGLLFDLIMDRVALAINAERVSGSGNLHLDALILIPYNDGFVSLDASAAYTGLEVDTSPDFAIIGLNDTDFASAQPQPNNWLMPANDEAPLLVVAGQGATAHDKTVTAAIFAVVFRRWRTGRGSEA